jgi:serine/threonine-protein kinase
MGPCTPLYASPEQLRNEKSMIDPRTDFYALGIIAL